MIASLMMYRRPETDAALARFWNLIRDTLAGHGFNCPETLSQDTEEFSVWRDPNLVLSQTCGMPYRLYLQDRVQLVGTPDYGLADCPPGFYRSAFVVRADDPRQALTDYQDKTFAYNQTISQSGFAAPFNHLKDQFWFTNTLHTGAHLASARAVADGSADIASLDAVTWNIIKTYEQFAANLRVLEWTDTTPGLPLITAKHHDADAICLAVSEAIQSLNVDDKAALCLQGLVRIAKSDYLAVPNPPPSVINEGTPRSRP